MAEKKSSMLHKSSGMVWGKDNYDTARGGGTPAGEEKAFGKVKVNPSGKGRGGWKKVGSPGSREPDQPRDAEGHFTYNSMIGKELKDISKSHGKSRGTTVPPMFNGGINGPHTKGDKAGDDEEKLKEWAGRWYHKLAGKGGEVAVRGAGYKGGTVIKIAPDDMHEIAKEWIIDRTGVDVKYDKKVKMYVDSKGNPVDISKRSEKGQFGRGNEKAKREGDTEKLGDLAEWETKKGRPTEEESAAKKEARVGSPAAVAEEDEEKAGMFGEKVVEDYKTPFEKGKEEVAEKKAEEKAKAEANVELRKAIVPDGEENNPELGDAQGKVISLLNNPENVEKMLSGETVASGKLLSAVNEALVELSDITPAYSDIPAKKFFKDEKYRNLREEPEFLKSIVKHYLNPEE